MFGFIEQLHAITTRQLHVFVAVVRNQGVNAAANALHLSQSAVSQSLRELERELEVQLFERVGRRLRLNEAGRRVLPRAEEVVDGLARLADTAREPTGPLSGSLNIAASATIGTYLLPPLAARFSARHPRTELYLNLRNTRQVVEDVLRFDADIGLIEGRTAEPRLRIEPWLDDELVVVASTQHPLAGRERVSVDELADAQWILREPGSGTRAVFEVAMGQHTGRLRVGMELAQHEAIKRAVRAGLGLGCLSRLAVAEELQRGELRALPSELVLGRTFSVVWHPARYRSPVWQAFRVLLDEDAPD